jgi:hypothetical protein
MARELMRPDVATAGERLVREVRQILPGDLEQSRKPRKFVEKADNFWTIKMQPRDQSYYITLRGKPHIYSDSSFEMKSEMGSYSRFYLRNTSEVSEALRLKGK